MGGEFMIHHYVYVVVITLMCLIYLLCLTRFIGRALIVHTLALLKENFPG